MDNDGTLRGGGVLLDGEVNLSVVGTDFAGNLPDDTEWANTTSYTWGLGASFSCDPTGCF